MGTDWSEMAVRIDRVLYCILLICAIGSSSESGVSNHDAATWSSQPDTRVHSECEDLNKAAQSIPTLCAVIGNERCAHVKAATTRAMARCNEEDETGGLGEDQSGTLAAVVKSETEFGRSLKLKLNLGSVRRRKAKQRKARRRRVKDAGGGARCT